MTRQGRSRFGALNGNWGTGCMYLLPRLQLTGSIGLSNLENKDIRTVDVLGQG
jgi:hypothetical protein